MLDNRNTIIAILLSVVVLFGWQFFVAGPRMEAERQRVAAEQIKRPLDVSGVPSASGTVSQPGTAGSSQPVIPAAGALSRADAIAASPRVAIDTASLKGSISLKGGRIDDLTLKGYHETVDKSSKLVDLLEPAGTAAAYFAETGWLPDAGQPTEVPGPNTAWAQDGTGTLTATTPVTMTWTNGQGFVFTRKISVDDRYMFQITDSVAAPSGATAKLLPYSAVRRFGTPHTSGYYILHEGPVGVFGNDGLKEPNYADVVKAGKIEPAKVAGGWIGFVDKYWAATLVPDKAVPMQPTFETAKLGDVQVYQVQMLGEAQAVGNGASAQLTTALFAGAKEVATIDGYKEQYGIDRFEKMIDWGWFHFITRPMFWLIDQLYKLFGNFGLAILGATVILKALFFPLANMSYESMSKMKKVQPELKDLQERFKDDRAKQQQAMMELYKREKINPLVGCVPMLLQIPVFFSLYKVLFITIEMRQAPFYGWIRDLAAPDPTSFVNLFGLLPFDSPAFMHIGIWPLIMGVTMFVQMKMNPAPPDPTQKIIFDWMPVVFTWMLAAFPAGLVIYWAWNNTLSVLQQGYIMRKNGVKIEVFDNIKGMFSKAPAKT